MRPVHSIQQSDTEQKGEQMRPGHLRHEATRTVKTRSGTVHTISDVLCDAVGTISYETLFSAVQIEDTTLLLGFQPALSVFKLPWPYVFLALETSAEAG